MTLPSGPRPTLLLLLALASCSWILAEPSGDEALADWRAQAAEVDTRLEGQKPVDGTWSRGDGEGTWRAWFQDGELVAVREDLRFGDYGERTARLYFDDGVLRYYTADGTGIAHGAGGAQEAARIQREIVFDSTGRDVARRQETAGVAGPVDQNVVVGVRRHAVEIQLEAQRLRSR